jgi:2-haloacid dehalogenase
MYPDVPNAIRQFACRKVILTNGSPDMIEPLVEHSGLKFDAVLSVHELSVYKPAPEVYQLALRTLQLEAESIGFVSSNCWDAIGAKAFGFTTFWINRAGAPVDHHGPAPDRIIATLADLPPIVEWARAP